MQLDVELIQAISQLISNLNDKVIIFIAVLIVIYLLIRAHQDNKQKRHYFDAMLREKNREIERLADENRRYREVYLPKVGLPMEDMQKVSAISATKNK